jgi:hypothetical protein
MKDQWTEESVQRLVAMDKLAARRIADKHNAELAKAFQNGVDSKRTGVATGQAGQQFKPATGEHETLLQQLRTQQEMAQPKSAPDEWTAEREDVEWLTTPTGNHYRVPDTNCGVEREVERLLKEINAALAAEEDKRADWNVVIEDLEKALAAERGKHPPVSGEWTAERVERYLPDHTESLAKAINAALVAERAEIDATP